MSNELTTVIAILLVAIIIFLLLREFNCWYWKINACLKQLEQTNMLLQHILTRLNDGGQVVYSETTLPADNVGQQSYAGNADSLLRFTGAVTLSEPKTCDGCNEKKQVTWYQLPNNKSVVLCKDCYAKWIDGQLSF